MNELVEKLSSKRWNERKEALDRIDARLRCGVCTQLEASDLVNALINVLLTDTHLQLVAAAANIITRAANTMKEDFAPLSKPTLLACLSGLRSSKPFVISALRSTVDATFNTLSMEAITEAVLVSLSDKAANPTMKEEAVGLLGRALQASGGSASITVRRTLFRRLLSPLVELMEARSDGVREAACHTLAIARRYLDDDSIYARLTLDVFDDNKKARIDLAYQRLSAVAKKVERPPKAESTLADAKMDIEVQVASLQKAIGKRHPLASSGVVPPPQSKKAKATASVTTTAQLPASFATEQHMSEEEVKRIFSQKSIPESVVNNLSSSNWRERFESVDRLYSAISSFSLDSPAFPQALIRLLLQAPGLKESNVQVRCRVLETIGAILEYSRVSFMCETLFETLTTNLVNLICTPKNVSSCETCLNGLERCCGLPVLGDALLRLAASTKIPKSTEHIILWLTQVIERSDGFCLNYLLTVKHLREGFNSSAEPVRHAYVKLAGAVYASLGRNSSGGVDVGSPSPEAFRADLEGSSKSAIAALLRDEFQGREDAAVAMAHETPRRISDRTASQVPLSFSSPTHRKLEGTSRRMTTVLNSPSEALQRSVYSGIEKPIFEKDEAEAEDEVKVVGDFAVESQSSLRLASTFCAVSVPLLIADFRAKKTRLVQLATGTLHPTRQRLEGDFIDAGMHPNLRHLLTLWDSNPDKTREALVLLTHLLLQHTPSRQKAPEHHRDLLSDTLANLDLLFQWMAESCFVSETLVPEVVSQALEYLDELIARLADAKMTLTPAEVRILLPWPLFAPHMLNQYFGQVSERCCRLTSLLFSLCRVLSADEVYLIVMEAMSTVTETEILKEMLLLVKLLLTRFPSLPNPSVADIKAIAQHVGSSHKEVHRAALECLKAARGAYSTEQISTMAGKLTERDRAFLEEALNKDASTTSFHTPLRPKIPYFDGGFSASYTNNPSILASVSRSQPMQCSRLTGPDDEEGCLHALRQWMLGVLAEDDRTKEARMVAFLVSKLLASPSLSPSPSTCDNDWAKTLDTALLAVSHLDFLHQSTATRDLLLPKASTLIEHLGLQMSHVALGSVPASNYTTEEACRFVRATVGFVISIFRAAFLTRDLTAHILSQLLAGLLLLHAVLDCICQGRFESLPLKGSFLFLLVDLDIARLLEEELLLTLEFVHEKLIISSLFTYIVALTSLANGQWSGNEAAESDIGRSWLAKNNLLLNMLNLAMKELAENQDDHRDDVNAVLKALETSPDGRVCLESTTFLSRMC
ncbi:Cytoskeleton-associated protein 5 [Echinococcus granulosus]|uniref:Cytoskeleton associated protein 5 n=1 Tax=Echinococcus granulosus TaxID=6210 RepID=A0A068WCZ4_ECHGR|nr:Cytoskeleton-associated protein 5 [Echinococcus granulosus]CDS15542.1 cytoskeleton associated protein 5 [Echinococcus granulosus]